MLISGELGAEFAWAAGGVASHLERCTCNEVCIWEESGISLDISTLLNQPWLAHAFFAIIVVGNAIDSAAKLFQQALEALQPVVANGSIKKICNSRIRRSSVLESMLTQRCRTRYHLMKGIAAVSSFPSVSQLFERCVE